MTSQMADGRHIENRLLAIDPCVIVRLTHYLIRRLQVESCSDTGHVTKIPDSKFWKFKMADGRKLIILKMVLFSGVGTNFGVG